MDDHWLRQGTKTEAWLAVFPCTVNGAELGDQEWRNALFISYGIEPLDLPFHCDVCNDKFSICHFLDCKKGRLITIRYNEIRDGVA